MVLITHNLNELQNIMSNYVGIVRSDIRLKRALNRLRILYGETEALYEKTTISPQLCELRNLIVIGYLIVKAAMARKESAQRAAATQPANVFICAPSASL